MLRRILLSLILLTLTTPAMANPPTKPLTDLHGDPLPNGAIARFGVNRLVHSGASYLEISPDGKYLASSGAGVRLWDLRDGKQIPQPHLPDSGSAILRFTPAGLQVLASSEGVRLFDPRTGKTRSRFLAPKHNDTPKRLVLADAGNLAAVAWKLGGIVVYDLTKQHQHPGPEVKEEVRDVCLSANGRFLAYAAEEQVAVWDLQAAKTVLLYPGPKQEKLEYTPQVVALDSEGKKVAFWPSEHLQIIETASGKPLHKIKAGYGSCHWMQFSADGEELQAITTSLEVAAWSTKSGKELHRRPPVNQRHGHYPTLSADGKWLALVGSYGEIEVAVLETGQPLLTLPRQPNLVTVSCPTSDAAVGCTATAELLWWSLKDGRLLRREQLPRPVKDDYPTFRLAPNGKVLFIGTAKQFTFYDTAAAKEIQTIKGLPNGGYNAVFSPDSKFLVNPVDEDEYQFGVWEVSSGKQVRHFSTKARALSLAMSPDNRSVAVQSYTEAMLYEVATGKLRHRMKLAPVERGEYVEGTLFAPNGRWLVTFRAGDIQLISLAEDSQKPLRLGEGRGRSSCVFSPDSRWLAWSDDYRPGLHLLDMSQPLLHAERMLGIQEGPVQVLAVSPDGKKIVSASDNGTALVWDLTKLQGQPRVQRAQRLEEDWQTLTTADAEMAYHAMRSLEKTPEDAVTLFEERLKAAAAVAPRRLKKLIGELDGDKFETRERATQELEKLGDLVEPALQQALTEEISAEQRKRIEKLLERLGRLEDDPELLRALRAVEVLEWIGAPAAQALLERLAQGAATARLTEAARKALERLRQR
jgi:WD40 repeat protein